MRDIPSDSEIHKIFELHKKYIELLYKNNLVFTININIHDIDFKVTHYEFLKTFMFCDIPVNFMEDYFDSRIIIYLDDILNLSIPHIVIINKGSHEYNEKYNKYEAIQDINLYEKCNKHTIQTYIEKIFNKYMMYPALVKYDIEPLNLQIYKMSFSLEV